MTIGNGSAGTKANVRLAADIGGTFTDIVLDVGAKRYTHKLLTTPKAPELAVIDGASGILAEAGVSFADIDIFVHGTTLATNAIVEGRLGTPPHLVKGVTYNDLELRLDSAVWRGRVVLDV